MRLSGLSLTLPLLLLVFAGSSYAGLVHRHYREVLQQQPLAVSELSKDQIPVTIIQDGEPIPQVVVAIEEKKLETSPAAVETDQAIVETEAIAEDIVKQIEQEEQRPIVADTAPKAEESTQDQQIVQQEIQQAIVEENQELLDAALAVKSLQAEAETPKEPEKPLEEVAAAPVKETESALPDIAVEVQEPIAESIADAAQPESAPVAIETTNKVKAVPPQTADADADVAESEPEPAVIAAVVVDTPAEAPAAGDALNVRQVTAATPTQTTTQQNFVQQLIQNSPLGQLINTFTGQGQQQQQQQQQPGQVAADEPATPAPTLPGFLNPQNAITSAQQAVQNAVQTAQNATSQAFQGLQQFANNLGTQFQNTLSSLSGQNQLSTADSTTPRPPGPIQSILNTFVGGNNQAGAAAAPAQPGQGPLQGILNFFGGNRPQGGGAVAIAAAPAPSENAAAASVDMVENVPPANVDNKVDIKRDELPEEQAQETDAAVGGETETDAINEVRNSAEVGVDSFEDAHPEELIVVNDDAGGEQQDVEIKGPSLSQYAA